MRKYLTYYVLLLISMAAWAQEPVEEKQEPPAFSMLRATENYTYLKDKETSPYEEDLLDPIKLIGLSKDKHVHLSIGGQFRPRYEHFSNRFWEGEEDLGFYTHRLALHTDLVLGKHLRVFAELYHGYVSGDEEFAQSDDIGFHQAFIDFKAPVSDQESITFRIGRQEMPFGSARLIGIREGPNIRRTFDASRVIYNHGKIKVQAFYAREVLPAFGAFDNEFTLFESNQPNPKLWGLDTQFKIKGLIGMTELYYFGFEAENATFNDISGNEIRHTIGLRRYGTLNKGTRFRYNTEIIYQFGTLGNANISAFDIEGDWHYRLSEQGWQPDLSLKLQYTSGDKETGDDKVGSFNPMFVNPAYYSLAATITPVNIIGVHPAIKIFPAERFNIYLEWAFFWRASENDGLYRPPRFPSRSGAGTDERSLGNQIGCELQYEFNRHFGFDLDVSYFMAGSFQKATGASEQILHVAPTLSYKF